MPVKRRFQTHVKLEHHRLFGSVTNPALRMATLSSAAQVDMAHLDWWPNGSRITYPEGRRQMIVGHVMLSFRTWRAWLTTELAYMELRRCVAPGFMSRYVFTRVDKKPFNVNKDFIYVGDEASKEAAIELLQEAYEKRFDVVVL